MNVPRSTQAFTLYCFATAIYLSVGGYLQVRWGLWGIAFNEVVFLALPAVAYVAILGLGFKKILPFSRPSLTDVLIVLLLTALVIAPMELWIHYQEKFWPLPREIETFYKKLLVREGFFHEALKILVLGLLPALCEEIFFRGLLQSLLLPSFGPWKTVLLTAVFFAAAHANPWYFSYYFFLGLFLGWCRQWKDNLSLCVLAHLANNVYSLYG